MFCQYTHNVWSAINYLTLLQATEIQEDLISQDQIKGGGGGGFGSICVRKVKRP